jgi:glycosyltransferase involved in cell wall biosynthesis
MKIIIVGTAYPYRGGIAAFNERIAYEYLKEGHGVEIYTFTLQYPSFLFPGKTQYSDEPSPKGLKIIRKINTVNPFNWIKVGREIRKKAPDLLITKFWMPFLAPCLGTIERIVRKNKKTSIVSILDNIIPHEKRIGDKLFVRYFVKATDGFIAMSKSVLTDLSLFDTKKPRLFSPHPLYDHYGDMIPKETAKSALGLEPETKYVLFFGIVRPYKGLDLLIDAFSDATLRNLNIKLLVAGEFYEDEKPYREQIQRLHLEEKIVLHNHFIADSKVNLYFSVCDIVAQPYRSATQSGVTQIAFHFEKPMLVTDVGGLAEIVLHDKIGYVVQPNPQDIADSLHDFFTQNREQVFGENVKIEKEKYAWTKMVEAIAKLSSKND